MDGERFDRFARTLVRASPRRAVLRLLAGGALGAVAARLGVEGAAAACVAAGKTCKKGDKCCAGSTCKGGTCKCDRGLKDCGQTCKECCADGDCPSRVCRNGTCRVDPCTDGVKNGTESDVDCGGSCAKCEDGKTCGTAADCASGVCTGNTCAAGTCADGVKNGVETDVDCGGSACPKCRDRRACAVDGDCQSGHCCGGRCQMCCANADCNAADNQTCGSGQCYCPDGRWPCAASGRCCGQGKQCCANGSCQECCTAADCPGGKCQGNLYSDGSICMPPTCFDGSKGGTETDVDCGGPDCPPCFSGRRCNTDNDCYGYCDPNPGPQFHTCRTSGGGCFVAGTRVAMTGGSSKPIELVEPGDRVFGRDGRVNRVLGVARPVLGDRPLYALNGGPAFVTAGHPFLTIDGWKAIDPAAARAEVPGLPVGRLVVGDRLLGLAKVLVPALAGGGSDPADDATARLEPVALRRLEGRPADPATPLYNLRVDGDHTYLADDLLVHNKLSLADDRLDLDHTPIA